MKQCLREVVRDSVLRMECQGIAEGPIHQSLCVSAWKDGQLELGEEAKAQSDSRGLGEDTEHSTWKQCSKHRSGLRGKQRKGFELVG